MVSPSVSSPANRIAYMRRATRSLDDRFVTSLAWARRSRVERVRVRPWA